MFWSKKTCKKGLFAAISTKRMCMLRVLFTAMMLCVWCAGVAFPQTTAQRKPTLRVLSFQGGREGEGDIIATLFSNEQALLQSFTVSVHTGAALNALLTEHNFQLSDYTDADTIAGVGRRLNADYVLSGSIRKLGTRNLLMATVIHVESFEQVAGLYRVYNTDNEVQRFLPSITAELIASTLGRDASKRDSLAIGPFSHPQGANAQHDAETLAQILAIEILKTGNYAILPRTSTMQAAITELDFQKDLWTEEEGMAAIGRAAKAEYVLGGAINRFGGLNMFTAQIFHVADGSVSHGISKNYGAMVDGIQLMEEIAIYLTDPGNAELRIAELNLKEGREERRKFLAQEKKMLAQAERQHKAEQKRQESEAKKELRRGSPMAQAMSAKRDDSYRNEVEWLSLFAGWETKGDNSAAGSSMVPVIIPSGIYWSPGPYSVLGLETRRIHFTREKEELFRFVTIAPAVGFVIGVGNRGRLFTNFLLEMGNLNERGLITPGISPGFSFGYIFNLPGFFEDLVTLNLSYRCILLDDHSTQAIDFGISVTCEALSRIFGK